MLTLWREYWTILERIIVSSPFSQVAIKTHAHHFVTRAHKFVIRAHDLIIFFKWHLTGSILSCIFCWQVFPHNIFVYRYRINSTFMKLIYFNNMISYFNHYNSILINLQSGTCFILTISLQEGIWYSLMLLKCKLTNNAFVPIHFISTSVRTRRTKFYRAVKLSHFRTYNVSCRIGPCIRNTWIKQILNPINGRHKNECF